MVQGPRDADRAGRHCWINVRRYIRSVARCLVKDGPGRLRLAAGIFQERQSDDEHQGAACRGMPQNSPSPYPPPHAGEGRERKSTRLNSSHANISYAVFCLKKKKIGRYHLLYRVVSVYLMSLEPSEQL